MALMRELAAFRIERRCADDSKTPLLFGKEVLFVCLPLLLSSP
jgi:hypothetical protein